MQFRQFIVACAVLGAMPAGAAEPADSASAQAAARDATRTETARLLEEQRNFELADVDGNLVLSWEEFRNFFVPQFHALDRNGDGVLRGDEHPPAKDANGQPVVPRDVSAEAFQQALKIAFDRADVDRSGTLSAREWATPLN